MRVLVTGATGFIGRALVAVLRREGHTVVAWVRSPERARARLGAEVEPVRSDTGIERLSEELERCDAVVNLAGEPILGGRWTTSRRRVLRDSRVGVTATLVRALAAAKRRPRVLVSGSAVGFYGDRADEILDEQASAGTGFLAELCREWEDAARQAEPLGVRVVLLRTGIALGRDGGALGPMLPPFRVGAGGPIGSGRQFMPWIHLHDLVRIIAFALVDERVKGAVNAVAPHPVTSRVFAKALGRALHRPVVLPLPAAALRALFGEAATVLLGSQRVEPVALRALGFPFEFPDIDAALADVVGGADVTVTPIVEEPDSQGNAASQRYLARRPPTYELRTSTVVHAPVAETFAFFSRAENLGMLTPAAMRFSVDGPAPVIAEGTAIDYRLRVGPLPVRWRSRIVRWVPGGGFVDLQEKGTYRSWWHEHSFRRLGNVTVMDDHVCYAPPFGAAGRLANRLFIAPTLRKIFQYRADVIRLRFGVSTRV